MEVKKKALFQFRFPTIVVAVALLGSMLALTILSFRPSVVGTGMGRIKILEFGWPLGFYYEENNGVQIVQQLEFLNLGLVAFFNTNEIESRIKRASFLFVVPLLVTLGFIMILYQ